ncbi:lytic polysaccharide monooxygenase [Streptomyces sp. V3I7]|uniref:lytic polysaccharide monooxygenase auxiliary activity family 9 protein n=1 Tax=Streptomyces sp. V3I7 TaxID=3042278 RepID=UPI002783DB54|nr:lytic polysaccharide monooxygenase [Streptomyces sp. V3I7]MDQ0993678.1 putative carbohydrate-binding protein with CBM5 and CBM33 domain [Streptomyces sp. V3I7]
MTRMTAPLRVTGATVTASALLSLVAAGPALAHGTPTSPVSRVYACSPEGGSTGSAACRAAIAANGAPFTAWDNLRVAGVAGRDRQTIPDGKLCSGGLPAYKGLDLTRTDWPATRLTPGGRLSMTYASTIAHAGTFKMYLTKPGYDPRKPLTWSDLPSRPFAEVRDPALTNGAYHFGATLPPDRTGHHVLYTVWQNSSTPDTYYSCSDVAFPTVGASASGGGEGTKATPAKPASARPVRTTEPSKAAPPSAGPSPSHRDASPAASAAPRAADGTPVASATGTGSSPSAPVVAGGAAAVLVLTGGAAVVLRLRGR